MKRVIAFLLALLLIVCLSVSAFASYDSNQGGNTPSDPKAPRTGSVAVIVLACVAVGAGGVYAVTKRKSK